MSIKISFNHWFIEESIKSEVDGAMLLEDEYGNSLRLRIYDSEIGEGSITKEQAELLIKFLTGAVSINKINN